MTKDMLKFGQLIMVFGILLAMCLPAQAEGPLASRTPDLPVSTGAGTADLGWAGSGDHDIGMASNGDFIVTWYQNGPIYKRAFSEDGTPKNPAETLVDTLAAGNGGHNNIGVRKDGSYVITYGFQDTDAVGFNADGIATFGPSTIMDGSTGTRSPKAIAVYNNADAADGAFVISTEGQHVKYGSKISKAGAVELGGATGEVLGSIGTAAWAGARRHSYSAAVTDTGNAVIYGGVMHPQDPANIRGGYMIYDDSTGSFDPAVPDGSRPFGTMLGYASGDFPDGKDGAFLGVGSLKWTMLEVDMNSAGDGVFVWMRNPGDDNAGVNNAGNLDIMAQQFNLSGTTLTTAESQFVVNTQTDGDQFSPDVSINDNGLFTIVWQDDDQNVYGKVFNPDGTGLGDQFRLNENAAVSNEAYYTPRVSMVAGSNKFAASYAFDTDYTGGGGTDWNLYAASFQVVPEPSTMLLLLIGGAIIATYRRKRN